MGADNTKAVGNGAAMREVLEALSAWANIVKDNPKDKTAMECVEFVETVVSSALASPPRNCDVGTASQQAQRFAELCTSHSKDGARGICDEKCPFYGKEYGSDCAIHWAQMPYERGIEE